jgi:archaellum component FlaC
MDPAETLSPEMEKRLRELALEVFSERAEYYLATKVRDEIRHTREALEAQIQRVWEAIDTLAQAQKRTEQRVNELAEAQKRTEQRVNELAEAQKRTEETLNRLSTQVSLLNKQVAQLAINLGSVTEEDAEDTVRMLIDQKGYELLKGPLALTFDGETDIVAEVKTPQLEFYWIIVEAKARVRQKEMRRWIARLKKKAFRQALQTHEIEPPFLAYMYARRVYQGVDKLAEESGVGLLTWHRERVPCRPLE